MKRRRFPLRLWRAVAPAIVALVAGVVLGVSPLSPFSGNPGSSSVSAQDPADLDYGFIDQQNLNHLLAQLNPGVAIYPTPGSG